VVTQDPKRRILKDTDIYQEDGKIQQIGKISTEADTVIDATGRVVIPGLINAHTHFAMSLFRGYGDDMHLEKWLQERIWPAEARMTEATMAAGADLGLLEMIRFGTTSFLDMYFMEPLLAERTAQAGMRGWMGWSMVDIETPEGQSNPRLEKMIPEFLQKWQGHETITPVVAPHGTYTCHGETLAKCAELAREHHTLLHIHLSETRTENADVENRHGRRPLAQLDAHGALAENTVLAHCGWITKQEVQRIAEAKAKTVHCPVSNMKLATGGHAPIPELLQAGASVALGTDGSASNNAASMFETIKLAALLSKQHRWDPTVIPAQTALDMATLGGAAALMRDDLGSIQEGKTCDLAIVDFDRPHLTPCHDVVSNLVYAAQATDITHNIVGGRVLLHEGEYTTLDKQQVITRAREAAREVTRG
jgi:5-methylthioadenosine/S-adenosylhomocysteine deaminase